MCRNNDNVLFPHGPKSILWTKSSYEHFASSFHRYHKHDLNVLSHVFTTGLGVWGAIQLALVLLSGDGGKYGPYGLWAVGMYTAIIAATTPLLTAVIHTAFVYGCVKLPIAWVMEQTQQLSMPLQLPLWLQNAIPDDSTLWCCGLAILVGYGLQDFSHWLFAEPTLMSSYIHTKPLTLVVHTLWLMPLVIDSVLDRFLFIPKLFVSRNRNFFCKVASRKAVEALREWIQKEVPEKPETTHIWPHDQKGTDDHVTQLEKDDGIMEAMRTIFAAHHFDILPVVEMNEIYVTAVGAIQEITSDAVFYTPHTDGPYWWLPGASLYRVLVGVTPNKMVRTNFNLQHVSEAKTLDIYDSLGFDYNRELHWIDHVPGQKNTSRRSLIKLHFVIYPKGWHRYGKLCAYLNYSYNTWARKNFVRTLRPKTLLQHLNAWWIFATTQINALLELHIGWSNLAYVLMTYSLGSTPFLILTSFRHYCIYISTFAFRSPPVSHGVLMRDCKFYKTLAMLHLSKRILPILDLPTDLPGIIIALLFFSITILATVRLGMVRTYFGSELGFVKPSWISGFPYNTIPHPMIVGQLLGFTSILFWFQNRMARETVLLIGAHMGFYTFHMVQEMLTSSY